MCWSYLRKHDIYAFSIILKPEMAQVVQSMIRDDKVRLYCMFNAMAADVLVMQGSRAGISSHGVVLVILLK